MLESSGTGSAWLSERMLHGCSWMERSWFVQGWDALKVSLAVKRERQQSVLPQQSFRFASRSVFVVWMLSHVLGAKSFGLVDVRSFFRLGEQLPLGTESLADLRVVHLWVLQWHLPSLTPRPDHERVHWSLDVLHGLLHHVPQVHLPPCVTEEKKSCYNTWKYIEIIYGKRWFLLWWREMRSARLFHGDAAEWTPCLKGRIISLQLTVKCVCERPLGLWDICFKSLSSAESFKESFAARSARSDTSSPSAPNQRVSDKYSYNDTRKPVISAKRGLNEIKMTLYKSLGKLLS